MKLLYVFVALLAVGLLCYMGRGKENYSIPVKSRLQRFNEESETYSLDSNAILDPVGVAVRNQHDRGLFKLEPILLSSPPDSLRHRQCAGVCHGDANGIINGEVSSDCARCIQWADRHTPGFGLTTKDEGIKARAAMHNFHVLHGAHGHSKPIPFHGHVHSVGGIGGIGSASPSVNNGILERTTGLFNVRT